MHRTIWTVEPIKYDTWINDSTDSTTSTYSMTPSGHTRYSRRDHPYQRFERRMKSLEHKLKLLTDIAVICKHEKY